MPSLTMSMPVTISVTQCSTCTRVFISRKKYSPSCEQALDRAGADVVDGLRGVDADLADALAQLVVDRAGAGDSSISFWWRRWIEQSRSPRWITLPCVSARTWTSTWRGSGR